MTEPEAAATGSEEPSGAPPPPSRWRRWLPFALAIGLALALAPIAQRWPSTHVVEIAPEPAKDVLAVSLVLGPAGEDPILSTQWAFPPGGASDRLRAEVRGPDGPYEATVVVERVGQAPSSRTHRLELDGSRLVTLFAR